MCPTRRWWQVNFSAVDEQLQGGDPPHDDKAVVTLLTALMAKELAERIRAQEMLSIDPSIHRLEGAAAGRADTLASQSGFFAGKVTDRDGQPGLFACCPTHGFARTRLRFFWRGGSDFPPHHVHLGHLVACS